MVCRAQSPISEKNLELYLETIAVRTWKWLEILWVNSWERTYWARFIYPLISDSCTIRQIVWRGLWRPFALCRLRHSYRGGSSCLIKECRSPDSKACDFLPKFGEKENQDEVNWRGYNVILEPQWNCWNVNNLDFYKISERKENHQLISSWYEIRQIWEQPKIHALLCK